MPKNFIACQKSLNEKSKPMQILNKFYEIEEKKENLPHSSGYLVLQLSDDEQYLFCGMMTITKERKI